MPCLAKSIASAALSLLCLGQPARAAVDPLSLRHALLTLRTHFDQIAPRMPYTDLRDTGKAVTIAGISTIMGTTLAAEGLRGLALDAPYLRSVRVLLYRAFPHLDRAALLAMAVGYPAHLYATGPAKAEAAPALIEQRARRAAVAALLNLPLDAAVNELLADPEGAARVLELADAFAAQDELWRRGVLQRSTVSTTVNR